MRTRLTRFAVLTALLLVSNQATADPTSKQIEKPAATEVSGGISWMFDYEAAKRRSKESGNPLFVVFRCER